eukprot:60923_1
MGNKVLNENTPDSWHHPNSWLNLLLEILHVAEGKTAQSAWKRTFSSVSIEKDNGNAHPGTVGENESYETCPDGVIFEGEPEDACKQNTSKCCRHVSYVSFFSKLADLLFKVVNPS